VRGVKRPQFLRNLQGLGVGAIGGTEAEATECIKGETFCESCGGGNFGKLFAKGSQYAAVKTGDKHIICHVVLTNQVAKCGGDIGFGLFDFDDHAGVGQCGEDFGECGNGDVFVTVGICLAIVFCPGVTCVEDFEFF
jgi:hypothetical protein